MILGADGLPLRRGVILLDTVGIGYHCGVQLLRQTDGWYKGVKAVWVPNYDGTLHDILWATFDQDEPVPDWIRRVPWFTMATQVLTTASVSPWTVDGTWNAANNSVELVGPGTDGAQGTTGTNSSGGGGGGGGGYLKLTNGAISGTVDFNVGQANVSSTTWENTAVSNCYFAEVANPPSGTTGAIGGVAGVSGSPSVTFTQSANNDGANGANSGTNHGGGGGGAVGGPSAGGSGNGGSTATGNGGSGGGGANNGATGNGGDSSGTITGGNGGPGSSGSGGGRGASTGNNGTGNSGGGASDSITTQTNLTGGNGGGGTDFDSLHGLGGGGGGSGQCTFNGTITSKGGDAGLYGGGGAGTGGCRGASSTRTVGVGSAGLIFISWTSASVVVSTWLFRA